MFGIGQHKIQLRPSVTVPGASGQASLGRDKNGNSDVHLEVWHLAQPQQLTPPAAVYVVWARAVGAPPENKGALRVGDDLRGESRFITAAQEFDLFVTAEVDPSPAAPSTQEVLRGSIPSQRAA
ncbi:MAG: hypothetical protein ACRD2E_10320 [Terriglobales bacterium]